MPSYPVLQPDGQLAIWSTVVDNFTYFDCDRENAVAILAERYRDGEKVAEHVAQVAAGTIPLNWWRDWPDLVAWATFMHDEEDETVKEAMKLTPDTMTRRYIAQVVKTCQADGRTDDARHELAIMTKRAEEAEFKLVAALGADKPDKPATPTERARLFAVVAAEQGRRARQAEAERDATAARVADLEAQLAAMTARAEEAEQALGRDVAQAYARMREAEALSAALREKRLRVEQAEAKLAAVNSELRDEMIRAQRAEQLLLVYRVLLTGAMIAASVQAGIPLGAKPFADGYFRALFEVAQESGTFAHEGCGTWGITEAMKQLRIVEEEPEPPTRV